MSEKKKYMSILMKIEKVKKYLGNVGLIPLNEKKLPACGPWKNKDVSNQVNEYTKIYGIRLNNLVLVDIDTDKDGKDIPETWKNNTYTQRTGGGGLHYIFKKDERFDNWKLARNNITNRKLDVKLGKTTFFVGAGSTSKKGEYKIINKQKPKRMPDDLFEYLNPYMAQYTNTEKETYVDPQPKKNPTPMSIQELTNIINMCPNNYFNNFDDWQKMGWAINYEQPTEDGLKLFINKSKSVPGYENEPTSTYTDFWVKANCFNPKQYTIGSVIYRLKKDNLWIPFNNTFKLQDTDIAQRACNLFGEDFFYNNGDSLVYQWNKTYWKVIKNSKMLTTILSQKLANYYYKQLTIYMKKQHNNQDDKSYDIIVDTLNKIYKKVRARGFVDKVKDTFITLIRQVDVVDLNKNSNEFVFNNCCIDLSTGLKTKPQQQNLATLSAGYDYKPSTQEDREELHKVLNTIFDNDEEIKNYTLLLLATSLSGLPVPKFVVFKGHGRNGKGTINEIMRLMLGDYYYKLNHKTLIKGRGQDRQDINNIKFKRFLLTTEPDANGQLDTNLMKDICSNDTILNARALYQTDSRVPKFSTTFMECNNLPPLDQSNADDALLERLVIIDFNAGFVAEDDKKLITNGGRIGKRHYHKRNPLYVSTAWREKMKFALFDILLDKCKDFLEDETIIDKVPESITTACSNYFLSNNDYLSYFNEKYCKDGDKKTFLKIRDIRQEFILSDLYKTCSKKEQKKLIPSKFQKLMIEWYPEYYEARKKVNGVDYKNILLHWYPNPETPREKKTTQVIEHYAFKQDSDEDDDDLDRMASESDIEEEVPADPVNGEMNKYCVSF